MESPDDEKMKNNREKRGWGSWKRRQRIKVGGDDAKDPKLAGRA